MLPVIAIVGRPNVGKSTLFNRLTHSRAALVADVSGVTRDRLYGQAEYDQHKFIVIDTGGIAGDQEGLAGLMEKQAWQAVLEANIIFLLVDARAGLNASDELIAQRLRETGKLIYLILNKSDGLDVNNLDSEFHRLGFAKYFSISSAHGHGIEKLMQSVSTEFPTAEKEIVEERGIKIAIVGRPNVGKSTLVNRMLGEERVLVYDMPGTTLDSIYIPFTRHEKNYTLIDTAGVRRRRAVEEAVEKFSVIKTLQSIEEAQVVVMVIDAQETVAEQDLRLLGFIVEAGKALVIVVNKWDGLSVDQRNKIKNEIDRRLDFVKFARIHFISALHGTGVGDIFKYVDEAYAAANQVMPTHELTRILETAVEAHQPPAPQGKLIKLRYAHAGGHNPPVIVIHGRRTEQLPISYRRYLINYFRKTLHMVGTPIRLVLKNE